MKILSLPFFLMFYAFAFAGETEWITTYQLLKEGGEDPDQIIEVTSNNGKGYWAGKILEFEHINYEMTGRVKVMITWVTDRTDYECHQVYIMYQSNLKDFTHRSIMLRRCQ
jgi:hypothetical protein